MANEKYDVLSIERARTAHPKLVDELIAIYHRANNRLGRARLRFAYVLRTFPEQDAIYSIGRRGRRGEGKVTNAKAGQSFHNYGLAVDIVLLIDRDNNGTFETASWDIKADWDKDLIADWQEVVIEFKKSGWEWGGDWKSSKDNPHFQKTFGNSWQSLLKKKNEGKVDCNGYVNL